MGKVDILHRYTTAIREAYPKLAIEQTALNRDGMHNDVVIVNGNFVCRFPKTDVAKNNLEQEVALHRFLRDKISLTIPQLERVTGDFVSYPLIEGVPLSRNIVMGLDERTRQSVLAQLGEFHEQIHGISSAEATGAGLSQSAAQRTFEDLMRLYERVEEVLFPKLWKHQRLWIEEHFAPLRTGSIQLNTRESLVHGDLGCYHILYDESKQRVAGIIDFGTAGIGSQAIDVGVLLDVYGEQLAKLIFSKSAYPTEVIDEARFRAGLGWLEWALYGIENRDDEMLLAHIGQSARDISPVGSGW
jgi:aminoglycoside 2''-phosphotransferase